MEPFGIFGESLRLLENKKIRQDFVSLVLIQASVSLFTLYSFLQAFGEGAFAAISSPSPGSLTVQKMLDVYSSVFVMGSILSIAIIYLSFRIMRRVLEESASVPEFSMKRKMQTYIAYVLSFFAAALSLKKIKLLAIPLAAVAVFFASRYAEKFSPPLSALLLISSVVLFLSYVAAVIYNLSRVFLSTAFFIARKVPPWQSVNESWDASGGREAKILVSIFFAGAVPFIAGIIASVVAAEAGKIVVQAFGFAAWTPLALQVFANGFFAAIGAFLLACTSAMIYLEIVRGDKS